jgi:spermidine/putrescine transport system permease protein
VSSAAGRAWPGSLLHRHRWLTPYLLLAPGLAFLALFFLVPLGFLGYQSLETQNPIDFSNSFSWAWHNYSDALTGYDQQLIRSFEYAAIATGIALLLSYPLAYWIAFRGGRWKNLFLLMIIAPFFVTYLIRTLAWETILSDNGVVVKFLRDVHILGPNGRLLATSAAVICGITYNFLPFMVLPLYVSLEQIDVRLLDAAHDLYASRVSSFLRVTLPLSLPGVFAGSMLVFIPAVGDFVNAQLLGTPRQYMIGNVIQSKFLQLTDYPQAAALSFTLMAAIMILVVIYSRLLGTERLTG